MSYDNKIIEEIRTLSGLGYGSRKIARIVLGSETKKSTVNYILGRTQVEDEPDELSNNQPRTILFIPDAQVRGDVDMTYLRAIGKYIVDKKPDIIVNAGDFFDFPSLSSYDKGKLSFEGRRLKADLAAGKLGMEILLAPLREYQQFNSDYNPRMVFTLGNHEQRLMRLPTDNPELSGFIGYHLLELEKDWEVHDFLKPVNIQGINFVHYLQNPMNGRPYGGSAAAQLKAVGVSFVAGHKQTLDVAIQPVLDNTMRIGIVCGASYPFEESYKGYQGNNHFRGVVMLYEAKDGYADPSFISTDFLISRLDKK